MEKQLSLPCVSRKDLWQAYISEQANGLKYSQFCYHLQHWQKKQQISMHFEHKAGDKLFIVFTGQKLLLIDKHTGEQKVVDELATFDWSKKDRQI
jgi:transposase